MSMSEYRCCKDKCQMNKWFTERKKLCSLTYQEAVDCVSHNYRTCKILPLNKRLSQIRTLVKETT